MADKQLTELASGGAVSDADLLLSRQDGSSEDKKITAGQIRTYLQAGLDIDNLSDGSVNTFMKIGAGTNSLLSHNATGTYLEGDIAIGYGATAGENGGAATDSQNLAVGYEALASGRYSCALGYSASATGLNSTAIGESATASGHKSVALGNDSGATGTQAIGIKGGGLADYAIGIGAAASAENAIAIGGACTHTNSIVMGKGNTSTDENQFVISGRIIKLDTVGNGNSGTLEGTNPAIDNKRCIGFTYDGSPNSGVALAISDDDTWHYIPADAVSGAGDTMTGQLNFSGTGHAGIKLLSLTTSQRDALTPAEGMLIYNETISKAQSYQGAAWVSIGSGTAGGGGAVDSVNGQTGDVSLDADDIDDSATTNKFVTSTDLSKLAALSGTNSGDQNVFGTISVSGQSDIIADGTDDTLTLIAGSNMTITTNASGDSITFTSSGGGSIAVEDEGSQVVAAATTFNFTGSGVSVSDAGSGEVTITVAGGAAPVDSVNGQTGTVSLDADDINDSATTNKFANAAQLSAIDNLANVATSGNYADLSGTPVIPAAISDLTDDSDFVQSDPSGVTGADAVTNIMSLTTAEYSAIGSPDSSTLYIITDAT